MRIALYPVIALFMHFIPVQVLAENLPTDNADQKNSTSLPTSEMSTSDASNGNVQKQAFSVNIKKEGNRAGNLPSLHLKIDQALAKLSNEPSLDELKRAALEQADLQRKETQKWKRTAKLQALLPELKINADYDMGRDESLDRYQEKPDRWGADTDRGYAFGATVHWRLGELVFNTDELKVYDLLSDRASRRETLLALLVGYYFERRRLQLTMQLTPPNNLQDLLDLRLRISELTAAIDALTDGRLTHRISQGSRHIK